MGMFNDHVSAGRTAWEYPYKGSELLHQAFKLKEKHKALETAARQKTANLLRDESVSQNDSRFAELKKDISTHGTLHEQCKVFELQFSREPDRVFMLGLGDITFFELV